MEGWVSWGGLRAGLWAGKWLIKKGDWCKVLEAFWCNSFVNNSMLFGLESRVRTFRPKVKLSRTIDRKIHPAWSQSGTGWLMSCDRCFFKKSKKRVIVEYCDWSHFKYYLLENVVLESHWSREIISQWMWSPITKRPYFPRIFLIVWVYKRTPRGIESILTSFNVFLNYAYCVQISDFYSYFYCGKTYK